MIPARLRELGIPEECIARRSACSERGRSFSIRPGEGEEVWRVAVDGCWLRESRRVDYLFWTRSRANRRVVILVELKGSNYGKALDQIESTLAVLCKRAVGNLVHGRTHPSLRHDKPEQGGVRAYVVFGTGRGRKMPQRLSKLERIRRKYGVRVQSKTGRFVAKGLDGL